MDPASKIKELAGQKFDEFLKIRNHFHQYPELSFQEFNTSKHIRLLLDRWGIDYDFPFVKTGILGRITGKPGGRTVALRADMDALPVKELNDWEFKSVNEGVMHACGHDIHMTCLLGAAWILNELKEDFKGEVLLIFQPGEEKVPGGARLMMEEGLFNSKKPDVILAQHVLPSMDSGNVGFKPGRYMASSDEIYLTVTGKGGHGAMPENINDPVLMAAHILISLQQEINRKAPRGVPTVLSFGKIIAEGAVNVIPNEVKLEGTFRTMNEEWRAEAHRLIRKISDGIASSMGGNCNAEIKHGYPVLHNNEEMTEIARSAAIEFLGREHVEEMDIRMTAEDFGWFASEYKAVMYRLGVKTPGDKNEYPLHTPEFRIDERAILTGTSLLSYLTLHFLEIKQD